MHKTINTTFKINHVFKYYRGSGKKIYLIVSNLQINNPLLMLRYVSMEMKKPSSMSRRAAASSFRKDRPAQWLK
jgi:hypothetical protein